MDPSTSGDQQLRPDRRPSHGLLAQLATTKGQISMKRRLQVLAAASVLAAGVALIPASTAWADDHDAPAKSSRAMERHMELMTEGNPGMAQMMDTPACLNMMKAPPFGG